MRRLASAALALVALAGLPGSGRAAGAWQTFLRPYRYIDLAPRGDTVWCATSEAGLVRFDRRTGKFSSLTRVPGELASNRLTALAFDRSGRLWVGTDGQGVSRLSADR